LATDTDNSISTKKLWQQLLLVGLLLAAGITLGANINKIYVIEERVNKIEVTQEKIFEWMNKKDVSDAIQAKNIEVIKEAVVKEEKNK